MGAGPAVVLIHGVGGDASNWDAIVPQLSQEFRVVRVDLRGHGRSSPITAPCRIEDFARDVTHLMDALDVRAARVVGFSLGGLVAQSLALEHAQRVEKLVLIGTAAGRSDAERARLQSRLAEMKSGGVARVAASSRDVWFTEAFQQAHPEKVEARVKQLLATDPASYMHAYAVFAATDLAERLHAIAVPTLIVTGENDVSGTAAMARRMHASIRGSQLRILPGLRHSLLIETPQQIAALLTQFFK